MRTPRRRSWPEKASSSRAVVGSRPPTSSYVSDGDAERRRGEMVMSRARLGRAPPAPSGARRRPLGGGARRSGAGMLRRRRSRSGRRSPPPRGQREQVAAPASPEPAGSQRRSWRSAHRLGPTAPKRAAAASMPSRRAGPVPCPGPVRIVSGRPSRSAVRRVTATVSSVQASATTIVSNAAVGHGLLGECFQAGRDRALLVMRGYDDDAQKPHGAPSAICSEPRS